MRSIKSQLKELRQSYGLPRNGWEKKNRNLLLSQIKGTINETASSLAMTDKLAMTTKKQYNLKQTLIRNFNIFTEVFVPRKLNLLMRPVMVILLIFGLGSGGWIATVAASQNSLPGDLLYPTKRLAEKTQVAVASVVSGDETETKLRVSFAKNRAQEAGKLLDSHEQTKIQQVPIVVSDLKKEISQVKTKLDEIKQDDNSKIGAVTLKDISDQTNEIKGLLKDTENKLNLTASSTLQTEAITKELTQAKNATKDVSVTATEVLVDKHLKGDATVSTEDVKRTVSDQIKDAVSDASQKDKVLDTVKVETDKIVKDLKAKISPSTTINTTTSTKISSSTQSVSADSNSLSATADTVNQVSSEVKKVSAMVEQKATEANTLLDKNNLIQAVKLMVEVNEANKQVEQSTSEVISHVREIAPQVVNKIAVIKNTPSVITNVSTTASSNASSTAGMSTTASTTVSTNTTKTSSTVGE